jgi:hypothetical protein
MTAITFDTLRFVKTLEAAGIEHRQAEAIAEAQRGAFSEMASIGDPVGKRDLELAIGKLRADLERDMAAMKFDLLKWIVGLALGQFALIMGILMKLSH